MNPDDVSKQMNTELVAELTSMLERIAVLERRRGLSSLGFGGDAAWPDSQARLDAMMALARWRLARLETFYALN